MKRLLLVRHAKAVQWGYDDDFNRELTEKGESDAARVGNYLATLRIFPDKIISSPASRAFQTAVIFAGQLNFLQNKIEEKQELYHGLSTGELIDFIHSMPAETSCLFLFGHNPSFEYYAHSLCRSFNGNMPTSSAVVIDFKTDLWTEVTARSGYLFGQFNPKEIPE
jgi:phosphohistidine phosphatase